MAQETFQAEAALSPSGVPVPPAVITPRSSIKRALNRIGARQFDPLTGQTYDEQLALVAWERAIGGNLEWAKWLSNRKEGMPLQGVEVGGTDGGPISVSILSFAGASAVKPIDVTPDHDHDHDPILGELV